MKTNSQLKPFLHFLDLLVRMRDAKIIELKAIQKKKEVRNHYIYFPNFEKVENGISLCKNCGEPKKDHFFESPYYCQDTINFFYFGSVLLNKRSSQKQVNSIMRMKDYNDILKKKNKK